MRLTTATIKRIQKNTDKKTPNIEGQNIMQDFSLLDLGMNQGEQSELVTITRDQYEKLRKSQYQAIPEKILEDRAYDLDYEVPRQALTFRAPKWSEVQNSIDVLRISAPNLFHDHFVIDIYKQIFTKLPLMPQYQYFYIEKQEFSLLPSELENGNGNGQEEQKNGSIFDIVNLSKQKKDKTFIDISKSRIDGTERMNEKDKKDSIVSLNPLKPDACQSQLIRRGEILVKTFCLKGYNLKAFAEQLACNNMDIDGPQAQNPYDFIRRILKSAFHKLQKFIKQECKIEVSPLSDEIQEQEIVTSLMYCHNKYPLVCCETLFNVVKGLCAMEHGQVTEGNSIKLYEQIGKDVTESQTKKQYSGVKTQLEHPQKQSILDEVELDLGSNGKQEMSSRSRRKKAPVLPPPSKSKGQHQRQIDSVRKLNSIWNSRLQTEMIHYYKKGKNIKEITIIFQTDYPKDRQNFTAVALRSALYKLLRVSVRKLMNVIQKFGSKSLPRLEPIGTKEVRYITSNNNGIKVRLLLLDVYLLTKYDEKIVAEAILEINNYLKEMKDNLVPIQREDSDEEISIPARKMRRSRRQKELRERRKIRDSSNRGRDIPGKKGQFDSSHYYQFS